MPRSLPPTQTGILVIGDIARSPRMCYHTRSLLINNPNGEVHVYALGDDGGLPEHLLDQDASRRVHFHQVPHFQPPRTLPRFMYLTLAILRIVWQCVWLFWQMVVVGPRLEWLLVQNPPSLPALLIAQLVRFTRGTKLLIDWHNFSYSILALSVGAAHWSTRVLRAVERVLGTHADAHLCVTKAMAEFLKSEWKVRGEARVLYDRPNEEFRRLRVDEVHAFVQRLRQELPVFQDNPMTTIHKKKAAWRDHRPALLVSGTSWTEDEDVGMMIEALQKYDRLAVQKTKLPSLLVVITGKGPLKEHYEQVMADINWQRVRITTAWLKPDDYPRLLGSADLGISMHASSSKLDLPMKIVDMFGCGLPVCSVDYQCIGELVKPGYGELFTDADGLCKQLVKLLSGFPENSLLNEIGDKIIEDYAQKNMRWRYSWKQTVWPLLTGSKQKRS